MIRSLRSPALLLAASLLANPASAATQHYHANLTGPSEVPANTTAGMGAFDAAYDTVSKTLTYTLTWSGLTGPATMAHIHGPAVAGKNAGVLVGLGMNPTSPLKVSAVLNAPEVQALDQRQLYVNVHTAAHKAGEIRGQVVAAP